MQQLSPPWQYNEVINGSMGNASFTLKYKKKPWYWQNAAGIAAKVGKFSVGRHWSSILNFNGGFPKPPFKLWYECPITNGEFFCNVIVYSCHKLYTNFVYFIQAVGCWRFVCVTICIVIVTCRMPFM